MKICTTTLLGPNTAKDFRRAHASARRVGIEDHLVIPWNATAEDVAAVQALEGVVLVDPIAGVRFDEARNWALKIAERTGFHWAVTLDTDEALCRAPSEDPPGVNPSTLGDWLDHARGDVFATADYDNAYSKPRVFRLPVMGKWEGPTHEFFCAPMGDLPREVLTFLEVPKTPKALVAKAKRDLKILSAPELQDDPRWAFYRGESWALIAAHDRSQTAQAVRNGVVQYTLCAGLRKQRGDFPREGAWACFKAMRLVYDHKGENAFQLLDLSYAGLACDRTCVEIPWFMAWTYLREDAKPNAYQWAAVAWAMVQGGAPCPRTYWREAQAYYEGPPEILAAASPEGPERDHWLDVARAQRDRRIADGFGS